MNEKDLLAEFERAALSHLDAAYNLARWLTRREQDAEDVVQEAYLRAFQYFRSFRGETGRAWMLQIVRNTCYTWLARNRTTEPGPAPATVLESVVSPGQDPQAQLERHEDRQLLLDAVDALPIEYREVVVLRELEGLAYKEIARISGIPIGTVMSRLARGRQKLHEILECQMEETGSDGLP